MREEYLKMQLGKHGISTLVPEAEQDLSQIFQYIMDELGFNIFKDETRAYFVAQIRDLRVFKSNEDSSIENEDSTIAK